MSFYFGLPEKSLMSAQGLCCSSQGRRRGLPTLPKCHCVGFNGEEPNGYTCLDNVVVRERWM